MKGRKYSLILLLLFIMIQTVCKKSSPTGPTGPVTFTFCPIDTAFINQATPLGNLNPPGHCFPSNHMGFYLVSGGIRPVYAMAAGTVKSIHFNSGSGDNRVEFTHTLTFESYFDHIRNLTAGITEGAQVEAGDLIGYGDPSVAAVDLGVVDYDIIRNFITPGRYHEFYIHCGDPYLYFPDSIRNMIYSKNPRTAEPRGGKIDFDIDGGLSGNWFLEGTPVTWEASSWVYGANQLALVYDMYDPSIIRIVSGGTLEATPFDCQVVGNGPGHSGITPASGKVKYELIRYGPPPVYNDILLIEMTGPRTLRAEVFPDKTTGEVSDFTAGAKTYIR